MCGVSIMRVSCWHRPAGAKVIAEALKRNNSCTSLDVSGNDIGSEGVRYLSLALATNKSLRTLVIRDPIRAQGVGYLALALSNPSCSLAALRLSDDLGLDVESGRWVTSSQQGSRHRSFQDRAPSTLAFWIMF